MDQVLRAVDNWAELGRRARYDATGLAKLTKVHVRQLQRFFRQRLGVSPQVWLNQLRLFEAKQLVLQGASTKEISFVLGFKQTSHFCREFRRAYGNSPRRLVVVDFSHPPEAGLSLTDNKLSLTDNHSSLPPAPNFPKSPVEIALMKTQHGPSQASSTSV